MTVPLKTRCSNCKKKTGINKLNCKFCHLDFCTTCLQPEYHKCSELLDCKTQSKQILSEQLFSNKCVKIKLEKL